MHRRRFLAATGGRHNQDSYEAAWEIAMGRKVRYPAPQYDAPVLLRLQAGASHRVDGSRQARLLYCLSGAGAIDGQDWEAGAAIEVARGESALLAASSAAEFHVIGVPVFDD